MSTAAQLKALKTQRANAKRSLTNFNNYIVSFDVEKDFPILERRMKEIEQQRMLFETVQLEIEQHEEDPEHENLRNSFDNKYYEAMNTAISLSQKNPLSTVSGPSTSSHSDSRSANQSANYVTRKLPSVNLPTFSGNYTEWIGFRDLFKSMVDDSDVPDVEKFYHLKGCLRDEASEVIAALELSGENYKVAWELLKERYDNRRVIRQTHVNSLLRIPAFSIETSIRSFLDQTQKHIRALKAMDEPVDSWGTLLIGIITQKLSPFLRDKWEENISKISQPTYNELISFLQLRAQLEDVQIYQRSEKNQFSSDKKQSSTQPRSQKACAASVSKSKCSLCDGDHWISQCEKFKKLSPQARFEAVKKAGLCLNCLRKNHRVIDCTLSPCRKCNRKHNIFLHFDKSATEDTSQSKSESQDDQPPKQSFVSCNHASVTTEALLATALVDLKNYQGKSRTCRVFLDAGSQANFVTEETADFLNLPRSLVNISVSGINNKDTEIKHVVTAKLKSRFSNYEKCIDFLVLPQITKLLPSLRVNRATFEIPKNIFLADPQFHQPGPIDLLIGVQLFFKLMSVGQIAIKEHPNAVLQKTQLGWIVAGEFNRTAPDNNEVQCNLAISNTTLNSTISKFWEIEEVPISKILSPEESKCEEHFKINTQRLEKGNYMVKLPFNEKKELLGESHLKASQRLANLVKRFERAPEFAKEYSNFLDEYQQLNHMTNIKNDDKTEPGFYFPHHAVVKKDSLTTKVRVVFDGSAKSSSGISINDAFMIGPILQNDLFSLLVRFRIHRFVLTADIEKMYRQIIVHPDDRSYQKILFRTDLQEPPQTFVLNTVTYGTSCAPYLAIRVLHQLAEDEKDSHPLASKILKEDFYVDDAMTGSDTLEAARELRDELITLLNKGGFVLRKWASNEPSLVPDNHERTDVSHMSIDKDSSVKTLGILWDFNEDRFTFSINLMEFGQKVTKRSILSEIGKLFDPLGLLGPVIVVAKIILQRLWKAGSNWDESVPLDIHTEWLEYKAQLPLLREIRFDRFVLTPDKINIQIHGFCDASEKAYGACVYLRSTDFSGNHHVSLVCSKSRIAPVSPMTIPRLELCACLLLSRLYGTAKQAMAFDNPSIYLWSDSTIALHWIKTEPHTLKTFVGNRVSEIQGNTRNCIWKHVPSLDNPADILSRGNFPREFLDSPLWQSGPNWLSKDESQWPQLNLSIKEVPETRKIIEKTAGLSLTICEKSLIEKYGSINKLQKVVAYIRRFIENAKMPENKRLESFTPEELELSLQLIIRLTQNAEFESEINWLKLGKGFNPQSKLNSLTPFLDDNGILRVGGRLSHSELVENQRNPILLPANHHVTRLIIENEHLRLNHAGSQTTLYSVRERYWPLNGIKMTRKIIHQCIRCFRAKPRGIEPIMGDLPQERVSYSRPFLHVGVDYCGPLYIKEKRFRNRNKLKVYIAIFVCMCTKAVHLEVVSDLTTETFIASLKRLFSRRGKARVIYSDNATNFVGASRELNELSALFRSNEHNEKIQEALLKDKISWKFIPPRAPHFGGLWEAAVKSFKNHFVRTVGDTLLTFEQLETYTIEIEAILNSRPLSPLSSDPNDLAPLTPGHFLIGEPLTSLPQADLTEIPSNRLSNWQHAQKLRHHFWKRWQKEYLHQLMMRNKWKADSNQNMPIGTVVIVKEDNAPPMQWNLGRITEILPGSDGITRVVKVKTSSGEYKRCVQKLCPLPIE